MKTQFRDKLRPRGWGKNGKTGIRQWIPRGLRERFKPRGRFRKGDNLEKIHKIPHKENNSTYLEQSEQSRQQSEQSRQQISIV